MDLTWCQQTNSDSRRTEWLLQERVSDAGGREAMVRSAIEGRLAQGCAAALVEHQPKYSGKRFRVDGLRERLDLSSSQPIGQVHRHGGIAAKGKLQTSLRVSPDASKSRAFVESSGMSALPVTNRVAFLPRADQIDAWDWFDTPFPVRGRSRRTISGTRRCIIAAVADPARP